MTIFERSSGALRAIAGGRDFLRTAGSILEQIDSPVNSTYNTGRGEAGPPASLRIGSESRARQLPKKSFADTRAHRFNEGDYD
jgi:hypothetical protein